MFLISSFNWVRLINLVLLGFFSFMYLVDFMFLTSVMPVLPLMPLWFL